MAVNSPQYKNKRIVEVTLNDLIVQSISSWANFAGNYQKNYTYNQTCTIPYFKHIKRIYFYQSGLWDDLGFVEINDVYKQGIVDATIHTSQKSGWFEYTSDQVQQIISKSSDNTVKIAVGCWDRYGMRSDAVGPTVIYFSYKD